DLVGVQVHGQDAVYTGDLQHVRHHFGRNRDARRTGATILAGITEIGDCCRDATGRGTAQGIDHHHDFHQVVIGGSTCGLQDEDILAAHVLVDLNHHLAIGKSSNGHFSKRHIQVIGHIYRQPRIGGAGENHEVVSRHCALPVTCYCTNNKAVEHSSYSTALANL